MIDETDRKLVELLQADAHRSNQELAQEVGLTASSVFERVKKLEQRGIILGYGARVDAAKLGKPLLAFVRISLGAGREESYSETLGKVSEICAAEPDILECHDVAGEDCLVLKLRAEGPKELQRLLAAVRDRAGIARSVTSIVLSTLKESSAVACPKPGQTEE